MNPSVNPQPDLVASVNGVCNPGCANMNGAYAYWSYWQSDVSLCCYWVWENKTFGGGFLIIYATRSGSGPVRYFACAFSNFPNYYFGGTDQLSDYCDSDNDVIKEITGFVQCKKATGALSGNFTLVAPAGRTCDGCTLEVTLGG